MRGYPDRYIILDTETVSHIPPDDPTNKVLTLRLGVAKVHDPISGLDTGQDYFFFRESVDLHQRISLLVCDSKPILIFAHNMGFDARICEFFRLLARGYYSIVPPDHMPGAGRFKEPLVVVDNSPFIVRLFRQDGQIIILCDTVQWFSCSLAELGESIGVVKGVMPPEDGSDSAWWEYCQRDVDVLAAGLEKLWAWLRSIRCADWQYTRASQSMYLWKTRYGKGRIEYPENSDSLTLDRHAYYGGRSECFRVGPIEGPIWKVDCNSMYPFLMRNCSYPYRVHSFDHTTGLRSDPKLEYPLAHTAEVWLESETDCYPVRCSDGTHFVRGRIRTILCGPELEIAFGRGHVKAVGRWTRYEMKNLFRGFVDEFYGHRMKARERGDAAQDLLCKLILNSLYGKFGQRTGEWQDVGPEYPTDHYATGKIVGREITRDMEFRVLAGFLQVRVRDDEDARSFVPIAAFVASYGRRHMDGIRMELDEDGIYYQCVDSLLISGDNYVRMGERGYLDPDKLGGWKWEGEFRHIVIRTVGNLDLDGRQIRTGIKSGATPIGANHYEIEEWETAPVGIYRGNVSSVSVRKIVKNLSDRYVRGSVSSDGCVRPFTISNWDVLPEIQKLNPLLGARSDREKGPRLGQSGPSNVVGPGE